MSISEQEIQRIAKLSCLKLDPAHIKQIEEKVTHILELVEQMKTANTQDVVPMAHPMDLDQPLRKDSITAKDERKELQAHVKYTEDGFYIVPQFIETE